MGNKIREGQRWSYLCRQGEEDSRLTIIKIENIDNQSIIHIKLDGLKLTKKSTGEIIGTSIEHLPISFEMFKTSVKTVEAIVETSINEGYLHWKKMFVEGTAGVWSVEIATAIEITEETYNV